MDAEFCNTSFDSTLSLLDVMNNPDPIKADLVRQLIEATGRAEGIAVGGRGGFALLFRIGELEKTLVNSRGEVRRFASLNTAGTFLRDIGVSRFEVDMTRYEPGRLRAPRPDRAEALKGTRTRLRQQPLEFQNAG